MLGPFTLAIIALLSANIVDMIYLGRLGIEALAAVTFCAPLLFIGNSANIGLGAGSMSAISRALGEGDEDKARRHGAAAFLLSLTVMSCLCVIGMFAVAPVLTIMGAEGEIFAMAKTYLYICIPGLIILGMASMANNLLRAGGEAFLPSTIMILGALLNIIIDPFLIFGIGPFPRLEMQGAAIATVAGNVGAALYALYLAFFRRKIVDFTAMTFGTLRRAWRVIGRVAFPAAGTNMIVPIGAAFATAIVARLGTIDVATFGVVGKAELLSVGLLYALSACIGAVTGQNGGAGHTDRVREAFKFSYLICVIWGLFMAAVLFIFAEPIMGWFTKDAQVIARGMSFFYIVPVTISFYGFVFVSAAGLNALGRPSYGLTYTILRSLILYIGLIWLGVEMAGLKGAFYGIAAANVLAGGLAIYWTLAKAPMSAQKS